MTIETDYSGWCAQQDAAISLSEKKRRDELTQVLFKKGEDIVKKYAARVGDEATQEFFSMRDLMIETDPATIPIDGNIGVDFILQATGEHSRKSDLEDLPESFDFVSICPIKKNYVHLPPLYTFHASGKFEFLSEESYDFEKINSAVSLLNKIEQKLAEKNAPPITSH